ncbi:hypothetical protein M9H77_08832 [Catharanthus roseus]|uniref:Uncharacterized protein n=1 Tax=Catharanthus roseus TaxID=4058 RepID=A0ACC0BZ30_CATRO|nr:hypothetical protein M9H77_08832 [Catharanthus roseus]
MEKELGPVLEDLSIGLSLNPSSLCYEVSLEELKVSLTVPSINNCLSSHFSLEDPLLSINVMFDPSYYGFGNLYDSLAKLTIVGLAFEFDRISLQHVSTITSTRRRRLTMEFEGQGENIGGKLILCYGDLTMNRFWRHDSAKEQVSKSKDFYRSYWRTRSVSLEFHYLELLIKQLRKCFEDSLKWKRERIWGFHLQFEELFWKFGVANEEQNDVKSFNTNSLTLKRNSRANDICDVESLLS